MDTKTRAEKIVKDWIAPMGLMGLTVSDAIKAITSQLDEAQAEVLEQNEVLVRLRINEAVREARKECDHEPCDACINKFNTQGFASARVQAAGIAREENIESQAQARITAERIEAMEPGR